MVLKDKLISIIVPVYQTKEYINDCLDSVINQTYRNLEIIVVDDGSTDGSGEICDSYAKADDRIKVIHGINGGLSHARNVGIDIAKGEYLVFIDSDDMVHPEFISYLYKLCESTGSDIAQCDFLMIKDKNDILSPQKVEHICIYSPQEVLAKTYMGFEAVRYIVAWNKMYKKQIFDNVRFPKGKIHEDAYTAHKLFWNAKKIVVSNLYLYWYLQRADSIIGKKFSVKRLDSIEASREKREFFKKNNLMKDYYDMTVQHYHNLWRNYRLVEENIENPKEFLITLKNEAKEVEKEILESDEGILLEKLRTIYPNLSADEKNIYRDIYGDRIAYTYQAFFRFPYGRITKGSKIAMYGGGSVGKSYYEQITKDEYCKIELWVDNLWSNYVKEGYPVSPIKKLCSTDYDYLLIAVQNKNVADEITENLVSWGIEKDKIIWEYPDDRQNTRQELINESMNICKKGSEKIVIMNTADYGNIGDQALSIKGIGFLKNYFKGYDVVEISGRQWDIAKDIIREKIEDVDKIFFVGGGYMGDLWTVESNRIKEMIECFPKNKKIFLPQSFYYGNKDNAEYDKRFFGKYDNIMFIHREEKSYQYFVANVSEKKSNVLFPDMALYDIEIQKERVRKGIIGCFRLDKEKVNKKVNNSVYDFCIKNSLSYKVIDTLVDRSITRTTRDKEYLELLENFKNAELVITDRLHGMIFCAITGTPCLAIDNVSRKVSGVYEWIKELDYIKVIDANDLTSENIIQFMKNHKNNYRSDLLRDKFDEMASVIKEWCKG